jgi:hypothetical protein
MRHFRFGKGSRVIAALAASTAAVAFGGLAASTGAHADPAWGPTAKPLVAVGSNTIEDVMNAGSGLAPSAGQAGVTFHNYTPLHDPSSFEQVYSWDAVSPYGVAAANDCISAKPGAAPIARPNGSTDGYVAISAAIANQAWSKTVATGCAAQSPTGSIDMGRSSGGPPSSLGACSFGSALCLAWVDFARDGVAYAYFINPNPPAGVTMPTPAQVDHLSLTTLKAIWGNANTLGTFTSPAGAADGSGGVTFASCFPQTGSGTAGYWAFNVLALAATQSAAVTAADTAAAAANCHNIEENGANTFQTTAASAIAADAGEASPPQVVVIPFSTGSWIAQNNGVAFNRSSTGITAGVALGCPDCGAAGDLPYVPGATETPNTTFYASSPYGRELWIDVNNASLNGAFPGQTNTPMRHMLGFIGNSYNGANDGATGTTNVSNINTSTGYICTAAFQGVVTTFGFTAPQSLPAGSCGNETLTLIFPGPYTRP